MQSKREREFTPSTLGNAKEVELTGCAQRRPLVQEITAGTLHMSSARLRSKLNSQTVCNSAQFLPNYCILTSHSNSPNRGIVCELPGHHVVLTNLPEAIIIGHHELTPCRDLPIVQADDFERTDDQQTDRYVQKGFLRIPHLHAEWEGLKKEAKQIDHLWNKERELIKTTRLRNCLTHRTCSLKYGIGD
ncbi:hypothetical protein scyTo_0020994 [Scyliorhinus torazame]|uniref:Uncharacterized protein n=1 Tax=Scyliorhinus torazame TaxID=75743 RepID=A0A401PTA2_SCYTO|nr:hypothetical protein [Scyliorhinus torazame]